MYNKTNTFGVKNTILTLVTLLIALGTSSVFAHGDGDEHGDMMGGNADGGMMGDGNNEELFSCFGGSGHLGYLGILIHILLFGLFIYGIYFLINKFSNNKKSNSAMEILEERFAKGEIKEKEFEEKKKILKK